MTRTPSLVRRSEDCRVLVHLGATKTGSTSIQGALEDARGAWTASGVGVPPRAAMRRLPFHAGVTKERRPADPAQRARDFSDLGQLARATGALVLSNEVFMRADPDAVVEGILRPVGTLLPIDVLVYLRDPADHYMSSLQQRLRSGMIVPPASKWKSALANLAAWVACPDVRVTARPFLSAKDGGLNVVEDFARAVSDWAGTELALPAVRRLNVSVNAEQMVALADLSRSGVPRAALLQVAMGFEVANLHAGRDAGGGTTPALSEVAAGAVETMARQERARIRVLFPEFAWPGVASRAASDDAVHLDIRAILADHDGVKVDRLVSVLLNDPPPDEYSSSGERASAWQTAIDISKEVFS